ncbi:hypothetical protein PQ478_09400 [Alkalihalophilus pseudofirmus]|uniref:hypothetical protein n=1 Tax=Alkalihalophilus pseudofirmus TaxID=79885 RepID=UPI00259B680F|nr:hypothetical protein [Alkalihalophilus pseudofirmus]WEG18683.1 hypothetical protein PQ478_09400 [Alkalihalophilus pseudofirmus]
MYKVKLKWNSTKDYDVVISKKEKEEALIEYWKVMAGDYYWGELVEIVNGKEKNLASFCKSHFA